MTATFATILATAQYYVSLISLCIQYFTTTLCAPLTPILLLVITLKGSLKNAGWSLDKDDVVIRWWWRLMIITKKQRMKRGRKDEMSMMTSMIIMEMMRFVIFYYNISIISLWNSVWLSDWVFWLFVCLFCVCIFIQEAEYYNKYAHKST